MKKIYSILILILMVLVLSIFIFARPFNYFFNYKENIVVLEIEEQNAKKSTDIGVTYQLAVDNFNKLLAKGGKTDKKIKIKWTKTNNAFSSVMGGLPLPSLYISYTDPLTLFDLRLKNSGIEIANAKEIINWDEDWISKLKNEADKLCNIDVDTVTNELEFLNNLKNNYQKDAYIKYKELAKYKNNSTRVNENLFGKTNGIDGIYEELGINQLHMSDINGEENDNRTIFDEKYIPLDYSFISGNFDSDKTQIDHKMYSTPFFKSVAHGFVNKSLLAEIVYLITYDKDNSNTIDLTEKLKIDNNGLEDSLWNLRSSATGLIENVTKAELFRAGNNLDKKFKRLDLENKDDLEKLKKLQDTKIPTKYGNNNLYINDKTIKELFTDWFGSLELQDVNGKKSAKDAGRKIQSFFSDMDKQQIILTAYRWLGSAFIPGFDIGEVYLLKKNNDNKWEPISNTNKNDGSQSFSKKSFFGSGINDIPGQAFGMARNTDGKEIEIDGQNKKPFVDWDLSDFKTFKINDLDNQSANSQIFREFEYQDKMAPFVSEKNGEDFFGANFDHNAQAGTGLHYGGLLSASSIPAYKYTSEFFLNKTSLINFSSNAGISYILGNDEYDVDSSVKDKTKDVTKLNHNYKSLEQFGIDTMPCAIQSEMREDGKEVKYPYRRQVATHQGPGMSIFKNADKEKNKIAAAFINYFINSNISSEAARNCAYFPSNLRSYLDFDKKNKKYKKLEKLDSDGKNANGEELINWDKRIMSTAQVPGISKAKYYQNLGLSKIYKKDNKGHIDSNPNNLKPITEFKANEKYYSFALVKGSEWFEGFFDEIVNDIVEQDNNDNICNLNAESESQEEKIKNDKSHFYAMKATPYNNGFRYSVITPYIKNHYSNTTENLEERIMTKNKFFEEKFNDISNMVYDTISGAKLVKESEINILKKVRWQ